MAKYTETQTRKILSSYGGIGSIIETQHGALMIEPFDKWPFLYYIFTGKLSPSEYSIKDDRLISRLRIDNGFEKLEYLLQVPINHPHMYNKTFPANEKTTISASFFPEWFYCSNCNRFDIIGKWWEIWKNIRNKHKMSVKKDDFVPPKCPYCLDNAVTKYKRRQFYHLEQVRFVMASPDGKLKDIYWERWPNAKKPSTDNENSRIELDFQNLCCDNQKLKYITSSKFSDLSGIRISCISCNQYNTLSGLFTLRLPVAPKSNLLYKPIIRSSNSIYYPIIISSVYMPVKEEIFPEDRAKIDRLVNNMNGSINEKVKLIYILLEEKYSMKTIKDHIKNKNKKTNKKLPLEPENTYRQKEYNFIINPNVNIDSEENFIYRKSGDLSSEYNISNLTMIKRLKVTAVQLGYTRLEPISNDQFMSSIISDQIIKAKYTSKYGKATKYLPAIENFGEGIFFNLDDNAVDLWLKKAKKVNKFKERISKILENIKNHEYDSIKNRFEDSNHLTKTLLIHTLSHILIKEMEFRCGYPATSISERLYVNKNNMHGILIYTTAGSEGSYGGLVSQGETGKFTSILQTALYRAYDCPSDPICYNTTEGQGIGGLNLAACYACALLPENVCEEFNSFLDRAILIDRDFGFFGHLIH